MTWDFPGVPGLRIWTVKEGDMDLIPDGKTETPQFCEKPACALQLVQRAYAVESVCQLENPCAAVQEPAWWGEGPSATTKTWHNQVNNKQQTK